MQITARDLALIAHVRRHRFLSSAHLVALDGGNAPNILARLRQLFDSGYLIRPLAQLATIPLNGNQPIIYGLGAKGARLLREHGHHIDDQIDWSEKTKRAGAIFIDHTIGISDFMVGLELACRRSQGTEIIHESEILAEAPYATRAAREPLRWVVQQTVGGKRQTWSVIPDGIFGLQFADDTGTFYMLELDRGSIPITRSAHDHRSITRKLQTYIDGWHAGRHLQQFGLKNLRVIFVTSSRARMENMLKTVDAITDGKGTGFLLFACQDDLSENNPLEIEWINGRRERVRLID